MSLKFEGKLFKGITHEYPEIGMDKFWNMSCQLYILTHLHTDHMEGLKRAEFKELLEEGQHSDPPIQLITSEITKKLITNDNTLRHLLPYVTCTKENLSQVFCLRSLENDDVKVTITLLDAGHCLGSVMVLLEGNHGNVLYTGDIRFDDIDIRNIGPLHDNNGSVKNIKSLYIDSTFCHPHTLYIPRRHDCRRIILQVLENWLAEGEDHICSLICDTQYGYESIFASIFEKFQQKIHVRDEIMTLYNGFEEIQNALTIDSLSTRIHCCQKTEFARSPQKDKNKKCELLHKTIVKCLKIKPSARWFALRRSQLFEISISGVGVGGNMTRLWYSSHASLNEIRKFVQYLNAENVYPNELPNLDNEVTTKNHMINLIYANDNDEIADENDINWFSSDSGPSGDYITLAFPSNTNLDQLELP